MGAVAVETAMVLAYFIGFLFISFQIGLVAYYQISIDAAAEMQARYVSLAGLSDTDAAALVNGSIPNVELHAKTRWSGDRNPANIDTAGMDPKYGFSSTSTRNGGYSFTIPMPKLSQITTDPNALFLMKSLNVPLSAFAISGSIREICIHSCIGQGGVATSTYANSRDYHTDGDDVMPYFMTFNFMRMCGADPAADLMVPAAGSADPHWTTCPNFSANQLQTTTENIRALGTAAHLDSSNDFYRLPGMQLQQSYTAGSTVPPADTEAGPFFELWCHRRFYYAIKYFMDINQTQRPDLEPATTVDTAYNPLVTTPYLRNRNKMATFFDKIATPGKPGGIRPDNPETFLDYIYYSAPGHPNAGWDAYPLTTTTNYKYDAANELTPWFGCGTT